MALQASRIISMQYSTDFQRTLELFRILTSTLHAASSHHSEQEGPFHGAIAVPSVTRCRCRRRRCCCCCCGHRFYIAIHQASLLSHAAYAARCLRYSYAGGVRRYTSDTWWMVMRRAAARCGEWAQHFSNASCLRHQWLWKFHSQHALTRIGEHTYEYMSHRCKFYR